MVRGRWTPGLRFSPAALCRARNASRRSLSPRVETGGGAYPEDAVSGKTPPRRLQPQDDGHQGQATLAGAVTRCPVGAQACPWFLPTGSQEDQ